jgi:hypothetical protein
MGDDDLTPIPQKLVDAFEQALGICKDWPHHKAEVSVDRRPHSIGAIAEWVQHYRGQLRPDAKQYLLAMLDQERWELQDEARTVDRDPSYKNGGRALEKIIAIKERKRSAG